MSNTLNSKGFKWSLTSLGTLVGILLAATPYLNLVNEVKAQKSEITSLKSKTEQDHDLLIQMSADIRYIKEDITERKRQIVNR